MAKYKVTITDYYYENLENEKSEISKLDAILLDYHCKTEEDVISAAKDADAVIVQFAPITRHVIESLRKCRIIVRYAIGVDNVDVGAAEEHGIYVCNVPDYGIDEVSNHAIALLFACVKKINIAAGAVREGRWNYQEVKPLYRMRGRILGLIGLGRIPTMVAKKMSGFGLDIVAYDPFKNEDDARCAGVRLVSMEELLRTSDYISVHCPLYKSTYHLIDRNAFAKMKDTVIFINTARGGVVCEHDLIEALQNGKIASAGLDVCESEPISQDSPLLKMANVIVTPHMAWYSQEAIDSLQHKAAEEVVRMLNGEKPKNPVNQPKEPRG
ncbi:MAG: C-terminal binding protein [Oscillospiraceae bacterium]